MGAARARQRARLAVSDGTLLVPDLWLDEAGNLLWLQVQCASTSAQEAIDISSQQTGR